MSLVPFDPSVHKFEKGKVFFYNNGKENQVLELHVWDSGKISFRTPFDHYHYFNSSNLSIEVPDPVREVRYFDSYFLRCSGKYKPSFGNIEITFLDGKFESAKKI
jgi:hypothetical protein